VSSRLRITTRVTVTGHADAATGTGMFNIALSGARAEAVRALLKKRGVDPDLLAVRGAGPLEPQDNGGTETARSLNRRVTFTVGIDE
jgi:outer membrane protein OmpA-like peptidoglycan-associated protein